MRVLYIKANPKAVKDSISLTVGEDFINQYKNKNPNDEIVELDLYKENFEHISLQDLNDYRSHVETGKMKVAAENFASFDKYVIACPMWNLSFPSILKTYIDHIIVSNVTFKYTKYGFPVGLLKNKKAVCIISRGGGYSFWPLSMFAFDSKYLKAILKFMGIKDIEFIKIENTAKNPAKVPNLIEKAKKSAKKIIENF